MNIHKREGHLSTWNVTVAPLYALKEEKNKNGHMKNILINLPCLPPEDISMGAHVCIKIIEFLIFL